MGKQPIEQEADVGGVLEKNKWVVVAVAVLLGLGCLYGLASIFGKEAPSPPGAKTACKEEVKESLESPTTARWEAMSTTVLGSDKFEVSGEVESDNANGDPVRHGFECDVEDTEGGGWNVLNVHTEVR